MHHLLVLVLAALAALAGPATCALDGRAAPPQGGVPPIRSLLAPTAAAPTPARAARPTSRAGGAAPVPARAPAKAPAAGVASAATWKCGTKPRATSRTACFNYVDADGQECMRCVTEAEVAAAKPDGSVGGLVKIGKGCVQAAGGGIVCIGNNAVAP